MTADELIERVHADVLELRTGTDDAGHFIRGIVAPYGKTADIGEYVESFAPGVFKRSIDHRGNRIGLMEMHNRQAFPVGMAATWEDTDDGLVGTFRTAPTQRGQEALDLAKSGEYGLSVGFVPVRNDVTEHAGRRHITRLEAKLDHVGLVHAPAYADAKVLVARDDTPAAFNPDSPATAPNLARWRALLGHRA